MVSRENLVPTPTVDKNGRFTTVFRKLFTPASPKQAIPAPEFQTDYNKDLVRVAGQHLMLDIYDDNETRSMIVAELKKYPDDLLKKLHAALTRDGMSERSTDRLRQKLRDEIESKPALEFLREAVRFYPYLGGMSRGACRRIVGGLHDYPQLPESLDYSIESKDVQDKCESLVRVMGATMSVGGVGGVTGFKRSPKGVVFSDDAFAELVMDFPERSLQIARAVNERQSFDPELIRRVIDGEASALGSGNL